MSFGLCKSHWSNSAITAGDSPPHAIRRSYKLGAEQQYKRDAYCTCTLTLLPDLIGTGTDFRLKGHKVAVTQGLKEET